MKKLFFALGLSAAIATGGSAHGAAADDNSTTGFTEQMSVAAYSKAADGRGAHLQFEDCMSRLNEGSTSLQHCVPQWAPPVAHHVASGPYQSVSVDGSAVTSWAVGKLSEGQFRAFAASHCPGGYDASIGDVFEAVCEPGTGDGEVVSVAWVYGRLEAVVSADGRGAHLQFEDCMSRLNEGSTSLQHCVPQWAPPAGENL